MDLSIAAYLLNPISTKTSQLERGRVLLSDTGGDGEARISFPAPKKTRLTQEALHAHDSFPLAMPKSSDPSVSSSRSKATAYNKSFGPFLEEYDIYEAIDEEPNNLSFLISLFDDGDSDSTADDEMFRRFQKLQRESDNESTLEHKILPKIFPLDKLEDNDVCYYLLNQPWKKWVLYGDEPPPGPPEPCLTIGFHHKHFATKALRHLRGHARPSEGSLAFPVYCVQLKSKDGPFQMCKLQNRHNVASMSQALLDLKRQIGQSEGFYNSAQIITIDMINTVYRLNCHWVSRGAGRDIFYSKILFSWAVEGLWAKSAYLSAKRTMSNFVEWIMTKTFGPILNDVRLLEDLLGPDASELDLGQSFISDRGSQTQYSNSQSHFQQPTQGPGTQNVRCRVPNL